MKSMLLQRLRQATRHQHEAVEAVVPLGAASLDPELYRQVLVRFRGFYATWEAKAAAGASEALAPILAARRKLPLLDADLLALGIPRETSQPMDPGLLPPMAGSDAALFGSMYVVEGATLGGQVISRQLERSSSFHDGIGYSFFQSYGKTTGQQWKAFVALLEDVPEGDTETVIESAQRTFSAFHDWFAQARFSVFTHGIK